MNLQSQNVISVTRWAATEALEKALTQCDNFALPLIPFLNSASTASSSAESSKAPRLTSPKMGKSN